MMIKIIIYIIVYVYLYSNLLLGTFTVRRVPIFFIDVFLKIFLLVYINLIYLFICVIL